MSSVLVCNTCGKSDMIARDAAAAYVPEKDDWELLCTFDDDVWCDRCEVRGWSEFSEKEVENENT